MAPRPLTPAELIERGDALARLDVRPHAEFDLGHLAGSGHLEPAEFLERRAELPSRERAVVTLAATPDAARDAAEALVAMGYADVAWLDAPLAGVEGGLAAREPAARLWRPARFLEERLALIPRGRAADLAAGSGREAVYLALEGFEVEAWDHAPEALERAARLAARHGATLRTVVADLERDDSRLPSDHYRLVTSFRFLHRPLFGAIARAVAPGGHVVIETYRVGQERFGRPKQRRFLLEPGELARAFPGFEVLCYEEPSPEQGPITSRLHARKPGGGP